MRICICTAVLLLWQTAQAQNVGIGTTAPTQKLDVAGAVKIGYHTTNNEAGTIRWNAVKNDFEGFNGQAWVSLTGGKSGWGNQTAYSIESEASNTYLNYSSNLAKSGREFGYSLAAHGDFMVAGALKDVLTTTENVGSIHLYKRNGNGWTRTGMSFDPDYKYDGYFGVSVGMSSSHLIAGAPNADDGGNTREGKAYVFSYDANGDMGIPAVLQPSDGATDDYFGSSVALDGAIAVVGAPGKDFGIIPNQVLSAGKVYIFQHNNGVWTQTTTLWAPDTKAQSDQFGDAVAIAGDYLVVGSAQKKVNGYNQAGKVYVYRRTGNNWNLIKEIIDDTPLNQEFFGAAVCLKDNWLFIGTNVSTGAGFVSAYTINGNEVSFHSKIEGSEPRTGNYFGTSIAYHDNTLLIGASRADVHSSRRQGKAYVFQLVNNQWTEQAILTSSQTEHGMVFGNAVALVPEFGIVGAPYADFEYYINHGRIFFFRH